MITQLSMKQEDERATPALLPTTIDKTKKNPLVSNKGYGSPLMTSNPGTTQASSFMEAYRRTYPRAQKVPHRLPSASPDSILPFSFNPSREFKPKTTGRREGWYNRIDAVPCATGRGLRRCTKEFHTTSILGRCYSTNRRFQGEKSRGEQRREG